MKTLLLCCFLFSYTFPVLNASASICSNDIPRQELEHLRIEIDEWIDEFDLNKQRSILPFFYKEFGPILATMNFLTNPLYSRRNKIFKIVKSALVLDDRIEHSDLEKQKSKNEIRKFYEWLIKSNPSVSLSERDLVLLLVRSYYTRQISSDYYTENYRMELRQDDFDEGYVKVFKNPGTFSSPYFFLVQKIFKLYPHKFSIYGLKQSPKEQLRMFHNAGIDVFKIKDLRQPHQSLIEQGFCM